MYQRLSGFLEQAILCDAIPDLEALCSNILTPYGITHFICANIYGLKCTADRKPLFGTYESDWMKHYMRSSLFIDDPLVLHSRGINNDGLPYYWSDIQMAIALTPRQNNVFKQAWDAGLKEGLMIPLFTGTNEFAVFSLAGPSLKRNDAVKGVLHSIAIQAHTRARQILLRDYADGQMPDRIRFATKPKVSALTNAEIGIIQLLSEDLGAIAIAQAKGISVSTVRKHIASAKKKMLTDELTGLISVAYRQGIIT